VVNHPLHKRPKLRRQRGDRTPGLAAASAAGSASATMPTCGIGPRPWRRAAWLTRRATTGATLDAVRMAEASSAKSGCKIRDIMLRSNVAVSLSFAGFTPLTGRQNTARFPAGKRPSALTPARWESLGPALGRPAQLAQTPPVPSPSARCIDGLLTG
jgi:hypothetical protein